MPQKSTVNLLRTLFVAFTGCIGVMIGTDALGSAGVGAMIGAALGLGVVLVDRLLNGITLRLFSSATFGLLIGFLFSNLLLSSRILAAASAQSQWIIGLVVYSTFGYLAMMLAVRSNRDEFALIIPYVRFRRATVQDAPLVIDSSVIIDGRVAQLCATGFISSSLIVPRFAVEELQALANSVDAMLCDRGKNGLERMQQLQRNPALSVSIHDTDADATMNCEARLLALAHLLDARILTTNANLCAIARVQNIPALNLHELSRAMTPILAAGDEADLSLVKEGRDIHQAVGYLSDGTMVVVNHAREHLGKTKRVVIGSSLQTSAGRLFFAEIKEAA